MKRAFHIAVIIMPVIILIVGVVLWRNHYIESLKSDTETVYKNTLLNPKNPQNSASNLKTTSVENEGNPGVVKEVNETDARMEESFSPDNMDNTENMTSEATLDNIADHQTLSPEAATAIKEYEEAHSIYLNAKEDLKDALAINPINWDRVRSERAKYTEAKESRIDALSNLAVYIDEAFDQLVGIIDREYETEEIIADLTAKDKQEALPRVKRTLELFKTMSQEELEHMVETIPNLKETIEQLQGEVE